MIDPLPEYIPPYESLDSNPDLAKRYPLNIVSPKPHAFLNTQYANEPVQQRRQGEQSVVIRPADATLRKIKTGTYVRVFNDRGSFEGRAEVSEDARPGVVLANVGYWASLSRTGNTVNVISQELRHGRGRQLLRQPGRGGSRLAWMITGAGDSRQQPGEPSEIAR